MNEHLVERFGRGKALRQLQVPTLVTARPIVTLNLSIRGYFKAFGQAVDPSHWTGFREVPSSTEVFDEGRMEHEQTLEISENNIVGPYSSKEDYLERHYSLVREDAVSPLRNVISEVQVYPHLMEKDSENDAYIYEKVHITGLTFVYAGIAARITFSLRRVGKKINWDQSKRLLTGSIVALSPATDLFKSVCCVAVIAARPLAGLEQNPPEIDLFFGSPDEFEIDPQQEWIMVESRSGFFEAHRYTLCGLQMLAKEKFPLSQHIVNLEQEVPAPGYVEKQPLKDLSHLFPTGGDDVLNVNILDGWPHRFPSELDESQMEALKRILAKRLAIVQGPPGTGKTHISVIALRVLLANMTPEDPPIIISAHTNHALDQLLRHVSKFEPEFIRLGGWTKDMEIIKPRTLWEVKDAARHSNPKGGLRGPALTKLKQLTREMTLLLAPLTQGKEPLTSGLFKKYGVISDIQYESLAKGAKEWVTAGTEDDVIGDIAMWLGDERINANRRTMPEDFGIEFEEADLEFEQLREIEAESRVFEDEDHDSLKGERIVFNEPFTGQKTIGVTEQTVKSELKKRDMWDIPSEHRGPVYRHMQLQVKDGIRKKFRKFAIQYAAVSQEAKIGMWELDYNYLKQARVIGMTTTGLSKYRALIQSLEPKVVLIEEAAETLEASISVACFETLEHLVLVGDHQQLRAKCHDEELAGKPFYLGVSMFERLVRNYVEFSQLKRQRRMIPEIRRLLKPIYDDLDDHPSVFGRLPVPGMGGVNSYFFTHEWPESSDNQMSKTNHDEANMVVGFFSYLMHNGMMPEDITVLTFYNGQRKLILRKLREHRNLQGGRFKVVTVDSYQGEENGVVLLSLVRSNRLRKIGFLDVENRVCVALSRAQRGFYIFGDAPLLCKSSMLWWYVVQAMAKNPCRVGFHLPLTCKKHDEKTFLKEPQDFEGLDGGCAKSCREELPCGHICTLSCHPFPHDAVNCQNRCNRQLKCGHPCTQLCYLDCKADCSCSKEQDVLSYAEAIIRSPENKRIPQALRSPRASPQLADYSTNDPKLDCKFNEETQSYRDFAAGGHVESDKNLAALVELDAADTRRKQLDEENFAALFGSSEDAVLVEKSNEMKLVRTMSNGHGGSRGVWKGRYEVPKPENTNPSKKQEVSLLDS